MSFDGNATVDLMGLRLDTVRVTVKESRIFEMKNSVRLETRNETARASGKPLSANPDGSCALIHPSIVIPVAPAAFAW